MPEGDTIWRAAAMLRERLAGRRVVRARPDALNRLAGSTVSAVDSIGKHLVIRFDNGWALHSHMRMRGLWQVYRHGERWRRPEWQAKAVLETADAVAVCFSAPVMEIVRDARAPLRHLGPDILADGWDSAEVVKRARALDPAPIGEVMLDQRVTAGIGNVYRCEALWQRRINPWAPTADLGDQQLAALFETARTAMRANLRGGYTRRFPGYGKGAVHGRRGRPCPRCGTPVRMKAMGEHPRFVYWCPSCQAQPGGGQTAAI